MLRDKIHSRAPLVLGIIGGILGIPCTLMGLAFANFAAIEVGFDVYIFMVLGISGSILGLVFGLLSRKIPMAAGVMQLIAAALVGLTLIGGCILILPVMILFIIAGFISLVQNRVEID